MLKLVKARLVERSLLPIIGFKQPFYQTCLSQFEQKVDNFYNKSPNPFITKKIIFVAKMLVGELGQKSSPNGDELTNLVTLARSSRPPFEH